MRARVLAFCLCHASFFGGAQSQDLPCVEEPALSEIAAELVVSGRGLAELAAESSTDLVGLRALVSDDQVTLRTWLTDLASRSDAPLVCGVARGERTAVVAAPRAGRLTLHGDELHVLVDRAFVDAYLAVRDADGGLARLGVLPVLTLPPLRRPARIQLVATGPGGPRPLAQIDLGGVEARSLRSTSSDVPASLAALRDGEHVPPLRPNRLLSRTAAEHATRVCRERQVAHVLARGRDPSTRMRSLGIDARVFGEVIGRASTLTGALDALYASPSHRLALVDRRFTDVGWAAVESAGSVCVVVQLAAWPRFVGR